MPEPKDKYTLFKNFMHNELGITREEIRDWVHEAVKEEARKLVSQSFGKFDPKKIVKDVMTEKEYYGNEKLHTELRKLLSDALMNRINLTVK
jgi:hypothetical protein